MAINWVLTDSGYKLPLSEIKSCGMVPSFYITLIKRRIVQVCSLMHSIQKSMFSVLGKINLIRSCRGGSPAPSPIPLATHLHNYGYILYDQAFSKSFNDKLESVQYNACLAITGAVTGKF